MKLFCLLAAAACAEASLEKSIKRIQRARRDAVLAVADVKRQAAVRQSVESGRKQLVSTAHPALVEAYEKTGRLEHSDILSLLAGTAKGTHKAVAAPRARPVISRLGGRDNDAAICDFKFVDGCYKQEGCAGDCPDGSFCNRDGYSDDDDGQDSACDGTGGSACESCVPEDDPVPPRGDVGSVEQCMTWGLPLYGAKECIACCADSPPLGSCASCGFGFVAEDINRFVDCIECEAGYEIVVVFSDCTGMCVESSSVADYTALGLGDMASSACVANAACYQDQDFIQALPTNGINNCFETLGDDDADDDDDEVASACADSTGWRACVEEALDSGEISGDDDFFGDDDEDDSICPDDDDDSVLTDDSTCADVETAPIFVKTCKNPISVCEDLWHAYVECTLGTILDCDLTCPSGGSTPEPTPGGGSSTPEPTPSGGSSTPEPTPSGGSLPPTPTPGSDGASRVAMGSAVLAAAVAALFAYAGL